MKMDSSYVANVGDGDASDTVPKAITKSSELSATAKYQRKGSMRISCSGMNKPSTELPCSLFKNGFNTVLHTSRCPYSYQVVYPFRRVL